MINTVLRHHCNVIIDGENTCGDNVELVPHAHKVEKIYCLCLGNNSASHPKMINRLEVHREGVTNRLYQIPKYCKCKSIL